MEHVRYQATASRDPIWTRVSDDPQREQFSNRFENQKASSQINRHEGTSTSYKAKKGLSVLSTAIFIAGEMAGSGVLALPRAVVDSGWIGSVLVIIFCVNAGYGGSRLGDCWAILEERYPEYRTPVRNPYATIAFRAVGRKTSLLVSGCIQFTLFGAGTVYLLLASQTVQELLEDFVTRVNFCVWFLVICIVVAPAMWLESPKDFSIVGVGALLTTAFSCAFIFSQIVIDGLNNETLVMHKPHSFHRFFLAFGTILFSFGGASTFPTIQNDMINKSKFSTSVIIGFSAILVLYFPVAVAGYFVYGDAVHPNIILTVSKTYLIVFANVLMGIHLILAFLIVINPVCQELEEVFQVPHKFHWKRCLLRSFMMLTMLFIGESIPRFGKILSLVGGSTVTLMTFVFPSLFYMRLCDQKGLDWSERYIPIHLRIYMWELIFIGVLGGAAATYSAILDIFGAVSITKPCYVS